jgi:hypothetical protein
MERDRPDAIIVQPSLPSKRAAELALQHRVPAVSVPRWFADEGGLMSYSAICGHAATAPPRSVMKSRRLIIRSPRRRGR